MKEVLEYLHASVLTPSPSHSWTHEVPLSTLHSWIAVPKAIKGISNDMNRFTAGGRLILADLCTKPSEVKSCKDKK